MLLILKTEEGSAQRHTSVFQNLEKARMLILLAPLEGAQRYHHLNSRTLGPQNCYKGFVWAEGTEFALTYHSSNRNIRCPAPHLWFYLPQLQMATVNNNQKILNGKFKKQKIDRVYITYYLGQCNEILCHFIPSIPAQESSSFRVPILYTLHSCKSFSNPLGCSTN